MVGDGKNHDLVILDGEWEVVGKTVEVDASETMVADVVKERVYEDVIGFSFKFKDQGFG